MEGGGGDHVSLAKKLAIAGSKFRALGGHRLNFRMSMLSGVSYHIYRVQVYGRH